MILSLYTYPTVLLFVCSVISVDVYKSKSVPRDRFDIDRRNYNLNHPPLAGEYDNIPVTVLYNDYEGEATVKSKSVLDKNDTDEGQNKVIATDLEAIELSDKEGFKPWTRSSSVGSQSRVAKAVDSILQDSIDNKNDKRRKVERRRLEQVRKTTINKDETDIDTNENTTVKVSQNENDYTTRKTVTQTPDKPQSTTVRFQKRTGTREPVVPIIESENYVYSHRGNFHYSYEGGDGTRAFGRGILKTSENGGGMGEAVEGSFSYTDKDGNDFSLSYTADENGYRPVGAHLPTPPPIPPAIQAALRLLATKTTPEPVTERVKKS